MLERRCVKNNFKATIHELGQSNTSTLATNLYNALTMA